MATVRPMILWGCAAILGIGAGLNYSRIYRQRSGIIEGKATASGFDSSADYTEMGTLLNNQHIMSLDGGQVELLKKYASRKGIPQQYVAGILDDVAEEHTAEQVLPVAQIITREIPKHPIVEGLADSWDHSGCQAAASKLRDFVATHPSQNPKKHG